MPYLFAIFLVASSLFACKIDSTRFIASEYFDKDISQLLLFASNMAYEENRTLIQNELNDYCFENINLYSSNFNSTDTELFVATRQNIVLIAFRGSENQNDILTDLDVKQIGFTHGKVHKGFYNSWLAMLELEPSITIDFMRLDDLIKEREDVVFLLSGHSLGGAVATLYASWLIEQGVSQDRVILYSFGAPAVGDREYATYYHEKLHLHRVVTQYDVIPYSTKAELILPHVDLNLLDFYDLDLGALWDFGSGKYNFKHFGYLKALNEEGEDVSSSYKSDEEVDGDSLNMQAHEMLTYLQSHQRHNAKYIDKRFDTFTPFASLSFIDSKSATLTLNDTNTSPLIALEWRRDSENKSLKIDASKPLKASILYRAWDGENFYSYENVTLPITINPSNDGFMRANNRWFNVMIALNSVQLEGNESLRIEAINQESSAFSQTTTQPFLLDSTHYLTSIASLSSSNEGLGFSHNEVMLYENERLTSIMLHCPTNNTVTIESKLGCLKNIAINEERVRLPATVMGHKNMRLDALESCTDRIEVRVKE